MTWFRCGGIPVTLKNAMNAVLNKKFGTSGQNYPPNGWPDDVNLLGPLPVKSASGAIASFTDGADGVPVKSCVVSFLPSGGGGTPSAPVAIVGHSGITLTNKDNMSTPTHTDTYTDTFGQTLYGGTRDLTTDKASVTTDLKDLGTLSWTADTNRTGVFYSSNITDAVTDNNAILCTAYVVNNAKNPNTISDYELCSRSSYGSKRVFIKNTDYAGYTGAQVASALSGVMLAYELATPTEITGLTPHEIDTLLGDNNVYADTGTTTVEYRADIDLALNAFQGSRSLSASLMRSESPEEVSEPEEIIQNTEEQEGENDER